MHSETSGKRTLLSELHPSIPALPSAVCVVRCDRYFSLLGANEAFYQLMECTPEEMGFRYAQRLGAFWNAEAADELAMLARAKEEGRSARFRHPLVTPAGKRVLETDAALVRVNDEWALCCVTRDCTREAGMESDLEQMHNMMMCVAGTTGLELFSYDEVSRRARVVVAAAVLGQLPESRTVFDDFPETLIRAGLVHPHDEATFLHAFDVPARQGARYAFDVRLGGPTPETGRWRWYRLTLAGCANTFLPGATGGGVLEDITEHKELAMAYLGDTQFYYALLSEKDAYCHVDLTDDVIHKVGGLWNLYSEVIGTQSYTQIVETFIERVVHPNDRAHYADLMRRENFISSLENGIDRLGCEFRRIVEQNRMAWMELSVHLLKDQVTHHVLALISLKNIDKKKRQELRLQSSSERDPLTQVLHKKAAETAVRARLCSSAPHDVSALIILDIDDFKRINDRWGHKVGDAALMRFVREVRCLAGKDDVIGRFGGDEFVLFLANAFDKEHVSRLVCGLFDRLAKAESPELSCSAGVVLMEGGLPYDEAFRRADVALYQAKASGKATYRFYSGAEEGEHALTFSYVRRRRLSEADEQEHEAEQECGSAEMSDAPAAEWALGPQDDLEAFAEFLSTNGEIAYLVDPETFTLICGNKAFYHRIGETPASCSGKKCYEAMQGRTTPCPFCSKANWTTDKFFAWRNTNKALEQEFLIKNKLVSWRGREVLLALAVDISNDKSVADSLNNGISEAHYLLAGIQRMSAAKDLTEVVDCALETVADFFRAGAVRLWTSAGVGEPYKCEVAWSRNPGALVPLIPADRALDVWLAAQRWDQPVLVESPEAVLNESFAMYRYLKDNGITSERWVRLVDHAQEDRPPEYLSVENLGANVRSVAFLESLSVFLENELSRRRMMDDLLRASIHDDLTGLLNRECYERRMREFDGDAVRSVGAVSANMNNMRAINSEKGFAEGNYYLRQFAAMLLDAFPSDAVYRLNGDEFAVVAVDLDREELDRRIRELCAMVRANGLFTVALGCSWDDVEKDLAAVTEQAVQAMEVDKKRFHDVAEDRVGDHDRRTSLRALVAALEAGRFLVYLQPKVRLSDGALVGAEALVRYRDDQMGVVPPVRFIQPLEDKGLIRHVDLFMLEQTCKLLERWEHAGAAVPVSVNLSRRTLLENDLVASAKSIAERYEFDRGNLEIEITESFAAIGKSVLYRAAHDLAGAGFSLSLDDFGTKYTDLSILSSIEFSMVKLDKSLIDELVADRVKQTVLKHIVSMCGELCVDVIAEGVETEEQERVLRTLGCRLGQGYLYSRPLPVEDFERMFMPGPLS